MKAAMRSVIGVARDIAGLFFDDGSLAIAVLLILAATALLALGAGFDGPEASVFLVSAVIAALVENVVRTARACVSSETRRLPVGTAAIPVQGVLRFPHR
jgi:hypothetical protein